MNFRKYRRPWVYLLLLALFAGLAPLTLLFSKQEQAPPLIRTRVDVVNILCTVKTGKGDYVEDLTREDFDIYEDGVKQEIRFFNREIGEDARPLSILLLIDTSGSVKSMLQFQQQAALEFLQQTLRENRDMAAVLQFDSDVSLVQDFTFDYSLLETAIRGIRAGGATKLYDALWLGARDLLRNEAGRRVQVVLSDGADTASQVGEREAIRAVQDEDIVIHAIGVQGEDYADFRALRRIALDTGGVFINSKADLARLRESFDAINQEIKNQYSLGYESTNRINDGSYRKIRVDIKRRGLKVTHRKGYHAPQS
jgi:Ca-activated chloride channel homolog